MFRTFKNILLLCMLCFVATGVPLYADTITISLPSFNLGGTGNLIFEGNLTKETPQQWHLSLNLASDGKALTLNLDPNQPMLLEVMLEDTIVTELIIEKNQIPGLQETGELTLTQEGITLEYLLNQTTLNLPDGAYSLRVTPQFDLDQAPVTPLTYAFDFNTQGTYYRALDTIKRNQTALQLYFPNPEATGLISVTRVIPYTNRPLRATLDQLELGPTAELGLPTGPSVPTGGSLSLNRRIANLFLPQDIGHYNTNATDGALAMEALVNSLASIKEVDGVQFYFGRRIVDTNFHGMVVNKPIYPSTDPVAYGILSTNTERFLLMPLPVSQTPRTVEQMFKTLQYLGQRELYGAQVQPALPHGMTLLDHQLEAGVLTLNLSEDFGQFTGLDRKLASVEALLYSFSSLDGVDAIQLQVQGQPLPAIGELDFTNPVTVTPYINPEVRP